MLQRQNGEAERLLRELGRQQQPRSGVEVAEDEEEVVLGLVLLSRPPPPRPANGVDGGGGGEDDQQERDLVPAKPIVKSEIISKLLN